MARRDAVVGCLKAIMKMHLAPPDEESDEEGDEEDSAGALAREKKRGDLELSDGAKEAVEAIQQNAFDAVGDLQCLFKEELAFYTDGMAKLAWKPEPELVWLQTCFFHAMDPRVVLAATDGEGGAADEADEDEDEDDDEPFEWGSAGGKQSGKRKRAAKPASKKRRGAV